MKTFSDIPKAFVETKKQEFVYKLACNIVDRVFVEPEGVERTLRLCGERMRKAQFCICNGQGNENMQCLLRPLS